MALPESSSFCLSSKIEIDETGFGYTLSLLSGRYKMIILYWLSEYKAVMRFNELRRQIGNISYKTLSNTLKELQADGLVLR
ncbi:HTH-type transcriptional activator hxlR [Oligella ureolytica]|uniref:HTH-type transcriptional activator hxlR n=1 Tax=Oligella ureolytica TaxID=90244 RepID=A0A378XHU5_9BURK|nr:HTH-type transcriptional activator hxlR [Oligella ureolytica]